MARYFDQKVARPIVALLPHWVRPNHLSVTRVLFLGPIIYWRDWPVIAVVLLICSSIFDIFDGPLARLRGQTSQFGAILDATGDKIFVLGTLLFACGDRVWIGFRIAIVALDVALTLFRPIKRWLGAPANSNTWGALKTWTQSVALGMVLSQITCLTVLAPWFFAAAVGLALLSLAGHFRDLRAPRDIRP